MGPSSRNSSRETNQTNPGTGALRCCKYLWETSTPGPGASQGAGSTTMCIYRQFIDMRHSEMSHWATFRKKSKREAALWRVQGVHTGMGASHSAKLQIWSSQPACGAFPESGHDIWDPGHLTMGKPKLGVCELALKWWYWKGNTVLWTWEERVCCFSVKAGANDCTTATAPGVTDSPSPLGLGLLHPSQTHVASPASQACAML